MSCNKVDYIKVLHSSARLVRFSHHCADMNCLGQFLSSADISFSIDTVAVDLVSSLKSNLISKEESLEQPSELTFWNGLVFAKFLILSATTTASTFFVLHHKR